MLKYSPCISGTMDKISWLISNGADVNNYKLENNKKGLSLNMIAEISKALHVSADYLIFGNDLRKDGLEDKLATVLHGCSDNERKVLYEAICALKQILINNRYDK